MNVGRLIERFSNWFFLSTSKTRVWSLSKGEWGERLSAKEVDSSLNEATHKRFHDIIIPSLNETAQIDHIENSLVNTSSKNSYFYDSSVGDRYYSFYGSYTYRGAIGGFERSKFLNNVRLVNEYSMGSAASFGEPTFSILTNIGSEESPNLGWSGYSYNWFQGCIINNDSECEARFINH